MNRHSANRRHNEPSVDRFDEGDGGSLPTRPTFRQAPGSPRASRVAQLLFIGHRRGTADRLAADASTFYRLAMEAFSERDVHRALAVVAATGATGSRAAFGIETVDAVVEAIPADEAAYIEWRFGDRAGLYMGRAEEQPWLHESLA